MDDAEALWRHWFEVLDREAWFTRDDAVDAALRERFGHLPEPAIAGELDGWSETPRGAVALVLALDQLPRNLWRGEARAFAGDAKARLVADIAIRRGVDRAVGPDERLFLYLPFEHSEDLADQDRACALIGALGDPVYTDYAEQHREVIRRFGRFPHRNAALGRPSTPAEEVYLADSDAGF